MIVLSPTRFHFIGHAGHKIKAYFVPYFRIYITATRQHSTLIVLSIAKCQKWQPYTYLTPSAKYLPTDLPLLSTIVSSLDSYPLQFDTKMHWLHWNLITIYFLLFSPGWWQTSAGVRGLQAASKLLPINYWGKWRTLSEIKETIIKKESHYLPTRIFSFRVDTNHEKKIGKMINP